MPEWGVSAGDLPYFRPSRVARRQQARKKVMTWGFHPCLITA
jgi:hypothetical protein